MGQSNHPFKCQKEQILNYLVNTTYKALKNDVLKEMYVHEN